ncbi:carboxylesterase/lipase family protein [Plantibacter sp. YIM 135347]|uniref:carboxylesterase/lipase family protein n=1 Tax=Plantibacter sp. YIM 135347 TaxID=3423919 RepID=UPI003D32894A
MTDRGAANGERRLTLPARFRRTEPTGDGLEVRVAGGRIRGVREGPMRVWRGVPYAAPPIGPLRFRAPQPVVRWNGVRDAGSYCDSATQALHGQFRGIGPGVPSGEDCLTVNVVSAAKPSRRGRRPVLVFIHGGGYSAGSSRDFSGQGRGFVRTGDVVYVSFNYRLGALGYLDLSRYSTSRRPIDSNLGLRDQVALLRWVRANIAAFGGDPHNVTLFGESAGGNAVTTLMTLPSTRHLFARAIAQSAPPNAVYPAALTAEWAEEFVELVREQAHGGRRRVGTGRAGAVDGRAGAVDGQAGAVDGRTGDTTARRSDGRSGSEGNARAGDGAGTAAAASAGASAHTREDRSEDIAAMLDRTSATDLVTACLTLQERTPDRFPGTFPLAPVVDGSFVREHPMRAFAAGRAHRIPLIIGTNDREGTLFRGRIDILPRSAGRIRAVFENAPEAARSPMRDAYPSLPARAAAADFAGDYAFWYPSVRVADLHSRYAPVHAYRFDVAPRLLRIVGLDATHGIEMHALFDEVDSTFGRTMTALGGRESYSAAGSRMRNAWLRFAVGRPPADDWPRYTEDERRTLIIGAVDRVEADPRSGRRRAWSAFLPLPAPGGTGP